MTVRPSPSHERFIAAVVSGKTQAAAYREAFPRAVARSSSNNSSKLMRLHNLEIQRRIDSLSAEVAVRASLTKQDIVEGLLNEARHGEGKSRVSAWMGLAKVLGFLVDHQEVTTRLYVIEAPPRAADVRTWEAEAQELSNISGDPGDAMHDATKRDDS